MRSDKFLPSLLAAAALGWSGQAPTGLAWRSLGMGGAGVAVVDDADAVLLNPAGLTQLGGPRTFLPLDSLGYKRKPFDLMVLGAGVDPSLENLFDIDRFRDRFKSTLDSATDQDPMVLVKNQRLLDDLYRFDRLPLPVSGSLEFKCAVQGFGIAVWNRNQAELMLDHGAITPKASMRVSTTTAVEAAVAQPFLDDRLSVGFGYRVVSRTLDERQYDVLELNTEGSKAPARMLRRTMDDAVKTSRWGHGFDLGALWFQSAGLRFGGSLRDVGMRFDDEFVVPNLSMGVAWAPIALQWRGSWARKVNLAFALDDVLHDTLGYKPLSKIDLGIECTQVILPYVLEQTLAVGLKGGYPSMLVSTELLRFLRAELLTYGEETGYFTGDRERRVWMARAGFGW